MLRVTLTSLALGLLSFTSPVATSNDFASETALEISETALTRNATITFAEKQAAFDDHLLSIYNEAELKSKGLSYEVYQKAMIGFHNFKQKGLVSPAKSVLTVIDFTKSSREKRLWIIDLNAKKILFNTVVAHGRNTGQDKAVKFSNTPNSYMSSLGFYLTDATYFGKHGLSLRLSGKDNDFNSNAMARAIVMHGADYATPAFARQHGRLGRSLGCPAVPQELSKDIIMAIKDKTVMYIHGNDKKYSSDYLNSTLAIEAFAHEAFESTVATL
ncbi:murein L,D-transpeptidase catalytic domain family protein [Pontibacter toksunensis]|uniref:Murein L,D-transpeptidase catalytic domain family protein n=1 Tax=Pontibacter toksunensis TaxID=1332631 RepID=A0ABW6BN37_9BACT